MIFFYRQTLDEFSEIQKLSREVPSHPPHPQSADSSHSSLLRNVRRQSQRSWRRSWRALRAQPKRFCCLALPASTLPLSFQDDLDINFEAKKQEVPKITSPNLDYPALSDALLVAKSYEKGKESTSIDEKIHGLYLLNHFWFWRSTPGCCTRHSRWRDARRWGAVVQHPCSWEAWYIRMFFNCCWICLFCCFAMLYPPSSEPWPLLQLFFAWFINCYVGSLYLVKIVENFVKTFYRICLFSSQS